jgi:hypothetical protein
MIHYCGERIGSIDLKTVKTGEESRTFADKRPRPQRSEAAIGKNDTVVTGPK